jgi:superfamily II RNA helicase
VPYLIEKECQHLLRKFPNFQEYLELPEYIELISLLGKGIGIHHAGMLPPFREIVEILFSKGFIQILFCTETLSVGINMPVKTTIFTSLEKYDGEHMRYLQSHEYVQSAGRAGRLGLDTIGHVIHLNNLFKSPISLACYKGILSGKSQTFTSKFKISYSLLLRFLIGEQGIDTFFSQSLLNYQIQKQLTILSKTHINQPAKIKVINIIKKIR